MSRHRASVGWTTGVWQREAGKRLPIRERILFWRQLEALEILRQVFQSYFSPKFGVQIGNLETEYSESKRGTKCGSLGWVGLAGKTDSVHIFLT